MSEWSVRLVPAIRVTLRENTLRQAVFGLLFSISVFAGPITGQPSVNTQESKSSSYFRRIHHGDLIDVHVAGHLDFDWRGRLNPEGFLDGFDKVSNQIYALCKTEAEVASELNRILAEFIREPRTEVKVLDISQRPPAVVDGAVATPTRFQIKREVRLIELITAAGGISDRSNGKIGIIRPQGLSCVDSDSAEGAANEMGRPIEITISDMLSGRVNANPIIVSGDMVVIAEAPPIFLVGAVAIQGRMDHRPEMNVSRAIDASGGALKDADLVRVMIFRRSGSTSETFPIDLEKVRSGVAPDMELRPYDIVDIPFKGRPPRKFPPVLETEYNRNENRSKYPLKIID